MDMRELKPVHFHGDEIVTFMHEGQPYVSMRRIVENMGMVWAGQHAKLLSQQTKFDCIDTYTVGADGRRREMLCMPNSKLPLWLASINPAKIKDEVVRSKVELYQAESAIVLHDYWTSGKVQRAVAVVSQTVPVLSPADVEVLRSAAARGGFAGALKATETAALARRDLLPSYENSLLSIQVVEMAGVPHGAPVGGICNMVTARLRDFCCSIGNGGGCFRTEPYLNPKRPWRFAVDRVKDWLHGPEGGKQMIEEAFQQLLARRNGPFVPDEIDSIGF